jgi:hypothetical protein
MAHAHLFQSPGALAGAPVEQSPPLLFRKRLAEYLASARARGDLAAPNPYALACVFAGTLWEAAFFEHVFSSAHATGKNEEPFIKDFVRLIWRGIAPTQTAPGRSPAASPKRVAADSSTKRRASKLAPRSKFRKPLSDKL